jgi:hypothetical protein
MILSKFGGQFSERELYEITTDDALSFLNQLTEGKRNRPERFGQQMLGTD